MAQANILHGGLMKVPQCRALNVAWAGPRSRYEMRDDQAAKGDRIAENGVVDRNPGERLQRKKTWATE